MKNVAGSAAITAAACLMVAMIAAFSLTGRWPGGASMARHTPNGIVSLPPEQISRVEIVQGGNRLIFRRRGHEWAFEDVDAAPEVSDHIETALRFLNVSAPLRVLATGEFADADMRDFGLDPPHRIIGLLAGDGAVTSIEFGGLSPAQTSHYARIIGQASIYLMPRHVGAEWQLAADMAQRGAKSNRHPGSRAATSTNLLLPVSLTQIWAVEVVARGNLQRFERDAAGNWFDHVGEHVHLSAADAHIADPQQAKAIAIELAAFEQTPIEATIAETGDHDLLARTGLEYPALILLLYARDNSQAVARIGLGELAEDGFHRYARSLDNDTVITIPGYAAAHLTALLRLAK